MAERVADIMAFVGRRGCGKTTQMKKMLRVNRRNLIIPSDRADSAWHGIRELKGEWRRKIDERTGREVPYYVLPDIDTFTGNRVVHIEGQYAREMFDAIARPDGFRNGGLFMDDFKNYLPAQGNLRGEVLGLFRRGRFSMVDIYLAAHSFQDINAQLVGFGVQWIVFDVERGPTDAVKNKMGDQFDGLMATMHHVKELVKRDRHACLPFPPIQ